MRTLEQFQERIKHYKGIDYIYSPEVGYIAWQVATGDNLELMFIEATVAGKGLGLELYRMMVRKLLAEGKRPYHSVMGYRLGSNKAAESFYKKMGWQERNLGRSIYRDDDTVVFWITWEDLLRNLGMTEVVSK